MVPVPVPVPQLDRQKMYAHATTLPTMIFQYRTGKNICHSSILKKKKKTKLPQKFHASVTFLITSLDCFHA